MIGFRRAHVGKHLVPTRCVSRLSRWWCITSKLYLLLISVCSLLFPPSQFLSTNQYFLRGIAMFTLVFIMVFSSIVTASSNETSLVVGWVPDPDGRGTFSLISSCLLTLGLCVWSAMHLNVPPHPETITSEWIRIFKWGFIGLFGPELVLFAAWRQYNSARALSAEVKRLNDEMSIASETNKSPSASKDQFQKTNSNSTSPTYPWTMVHSFYAGMGGFVIELDESATGFIPNNSRLTVSARGIAFLARCGHLPNIKKEDIKDKSKADGLGKFLVCVQAGWMMVQVLSRIAVGLPVTLLEVNTLGHVFCAMVIYILWWHKPRLVHESTKLKGDWVEPLCAYMYMSSQVSGWTSTHAGILWRPWVIPELTTLTFFTPRPENRENGVASKVEQPPIISHLRKSTGSQESLEISSQTCNTEHTSDLLISENRLNLGYFGVTPASRTGTGGGFARSETSEKVQSPNTLQFTRWGLAAEAVRLYPDIKRRFVPRQDLNGRKDGVDCFEPIIEELVMESSSNWGAEDLLRGTHGLVMGMALWFTSMAYGGVHMAAWNDHFPSQIEAWLWRSSAIYISASALLWLIINLIAHESKTFNDYWDSVLQLRAHWPSYLVLGSLCTIGGVAYIFARVFLVLEAFISIRRLPVAAYTTPDWTQLIPHF